MRARDRLVFKVAQSPEEFEQVYRLNYRTFVEEIPQHAPNPDRVLVDQRLERSTCYVCLREGRVLGMVAICDRRPFSLDAKLPDLDDYLVRMPVPARRPCEIRLLAVEPGHRSGLVFRGLIEHLHRHCRERGYDVALISAAGSQAHLYRNLGFFPFGPPLGTELAPYQGMALTWESLSRAAKAVLEHEAAL